MSESGSRVLVLQRGTKDRSAVFDSLLGVGLYPIGKPWTWRPPIIEEIIDLIIVDTDHLRKSDIEVCSTIKGRRSEPLLLTTFERDEELLVLAYQAGVDECIAKPIGGELLRAKIRRWLRWTRPH